MMIFLRIVMIVGSVSLSGCHNRDTFEHAIAKHKDSLIDQVNSAGTGAPYFTIKTLNPTWQVSAQTPIVAIPDFSLQDHKGQQRGKELFKDRVSIVGFFFATCHGFCPFLIESMKAIEKSLGPNIRGVQFVALTVNPEQDTPDVLGRYHQARKLTSRWTLLTGAKKTIYDLARVTFASQVFKRKNSGAEANFVHSEHLYVIDSQGRLRGILNGTRVAIKQEAKQVLALLNVH